MSELLVRRCNICGETRLLESFPRSKGKPLGRGYRCRQCEAAQQRERNKLPEVKKRKAAYNREYSKAYRSTEKGKRSMREDLRKRRERHPERVKATATVNNALRAGKIEKPSYCCVDSSDCSGRIEGHHPDYSRPMCVVWLCQKHHREYHLNAR